MNSTSIPDQNPGSASSCCGGGASKTTSTKSTSSANSTNSATLPADAHAVRDQVRQGYARIAQAGAWSSASLAVAESGACCTPAEAEASSCCAPAEAEASSCCAPAPAAEAVGEASSCCAPSVATTAAGGGCCGPATFSPEQLATAIGYSQQDLAATPEGANLGLSCGNPTALASLRAGEIVLDLGSGGGFDCFVAGPKVGRTGRVIGVDMTPEMISRARGNVAGYREVSGLDNVEFRLGEIEHLPVADASVDVVISNCVLNLSPDKPQVWREIARVLKPGGRVAVSDLALLRPVPASVLRDVEALVGCVAGAALVDDVRRMAEEAGLKDVVLTAKPQYIEAMTNWEDPLYAKILRALPAGTKPSDFVTSLDVSARR